MGNLSNSHLKNLLVAKLEEKERVVEKIEKEGELDS